MRLWLPQLFSMIADFDNSNIIDSINYTGDNSLCTMIEFSVNKSIHNLESVETNGTCTIVVSVA